MTREREQIRQLELLRKKLARERAAAIRAARLRP